MVAKKWSRCLNLWLGTFSNRKVKIVSKNLTESDMCGPIHFDFYTTKLNSFDNERLCAILNRVKGVESVQWKGSLENVGHEVFTVTVESSRMQYFAAIHAVVLNLAYAFQATL